MSTFSEKWTYDSLQDDPVEDDYTRWSSCNSSNLQHRYLKCKEQADVRKCPQQIKSCKQGKFALQLEWNPHQNFIQPSLV